LPWSGDTPEIDRNGGIILKNKGAKQGWRLGDTIFRLRARYRAGWFFEPLALSRFSEWGFAVHLIAHAVCSCLLSTTEPLQHLLTVPPKKHAWREEFWEYGKKQRSTSHQPGIV
jgi:hypothetical protein